MEDTTVPALGRATFGWGQKAKYSRRADVFRCSPNIRHSSLHVERVIAPIRVSLRRGFDHGKTNHCPNRDSGNRCDHLHRHPVRYGFWWTRSRSEGRRHHHDHRLCCEPGRCNGRAYATVDPRTTSVAGNGRSKTVPRRERFKLHADRTLGGRRRRRVSLSHLGDRLLRARKLNRDQLGGADDPWRTIGISLTAVGGGP